MRPPQITDAGIQQQADACTNNLNGLRSAAQNSQRYADAMTITGGTLAAAGGLAAVIIPAGTSGSSAPPSGATAGTIAAASVAAAGAILALLSKTADSPTIALDSHHKKSPQWIAGLNVINQTMTPGSSGATPAQRGWVAKRLTECVSDTPETVIPPAPGPIQEIAAAPPVGPREPAPARRDTTIALHW